MGLSKKFGLVILSAIIIGVLTKNFFVLLFVFIGGCYGVYHWHKREIGRINSFWKREEKRIWKEKQQTKAKFKREKEAIRIKLKGGGKLKNLSKEEVTKLVNYGWEKEVKKEIAEDEKMILEREKLLAYGKLRDEDLIVLRAENRLVAEKLRSDIESNDRKEEYYGSLIREVEKRKWKRLRR